MNIAERIMQTHVWKWLINAERFVEFVSSAVVIITLTLVVLGRHIFHYNFLGYTEILVLAAFWMYFIGASAGSYEESHITADILSQFVGERTKLKLGLFSKFMQVIIGVPLIMLSWGMLKFDIQTGQTTVDLEIPLLYSQAPILIGFALMTFYAFIYIIRDIYRLRELKDEPAAPAEEKK